MTGYFDAPPRPLTAEDVERVRSLVVGALAVTPYIDRVLTHLREAEGGNPESRALIAERDGTVAACALFGPVGGTPDTWRIDMIVTAPPVDPREIGSTIVDAIVEVARSNGARLVVAELPADPVIGSALTMLRANGFKQEARIPDYFRDNVALLFLRRSL